jgi:hypothetical protein
MLISMIVLLIGKIKSGKSLAAKILCDEFKLTEAAFAQPIKDFAISIGFTHDQVYGNQDQKLEINEFWGISGREFLQKFGTEVCRNTLPDIIPNMNMNGLQLHARIMEKKILDNSNKGIVISDGRFIDEIALVKKYNGIVIKIVRDDNKHIDMHSSEKQIDNLPYDNIIYNNGTIQQLRDKLIDIIQLTQSDQINI